MTPADRDQLDRDGYLILENYMGHQLLGELHQRISQLFLSEGDQAGSEFKQEEQTLRLANLVDKGEVFERAVAMPEILERIGHVLGPHFKLSSLNARSANPHSTWVQPLHADMGALRDDQGYWVCNTVWMLDDFTEENGAIRMVPGSHRWGRLPQQAVQDLQAPHPEERLITGKAGTVVVMNAHMWHGGTANRTAKPRCAMHGFYARWDKPQQQYQKRLLRPEVQERLTPQLRELLALDDPLNDELSSHVERTSGFLK
ncbi:MAG TPA: phytanoyl-CoA dioxygenase family protein [Bryobacteraceae bacterium]|jgi:ectoine hydroxylase-related dioxygenase (phytanoyl-CoA dioxygenase family)|nr:phytanoyl-CoA dioxygenase family protein [Bryobacteraceae bacterium]